MAVSAGYLEEMQPLWDVFWSDVWALAGFAIPMLIVSLPVSFIAALLGAVNRSAGTWSRLLRSAMRGFVMGTVTALTVSMSVEFLLTAEGFAETRRAIRLAANWQLFLTGPLLVFLFAFLAARRYAPAQGNLQRRYSLRRLFVYQLIAASLFGWWTFTRRSEIAQRRNVLAWELRDRDAKAVFVPLGWWVDARTENDEIVLSAGPHLATIDDDAFAPIVPHGSVSGVFAKSPSLTDRALKQLRGANRLRQLVIESDEITDEGIAELCDLPRLRYLDVRCPKVTAKSLESLAKLRSLRFLTIRQAQISEDEAAAFRQARRSVNLRLEGP